MFRGSLVVTDDEPVAMLAARPSEVNRPQTEPALAMQGPVFSWPNEGGTAAAPQSIMIIEHQVMRGWSSETDRWVQIMMTGIRAMTRDGTPYQP